jgi:AbrB family looped-hinge helix DNA binding protein
MTAIDFRVAANGRMVLPKAIRDAMGLHGEAKITAIVDKEGVHLVPMKERVRRAQELYRQAVKEPRSTDDFLQERYEEAVRDEAHIGGVSK